MMKRILMMLAVVSLAACQGEISERVQEETLYDMAAAPAPMMESDSFSRKSASGSSANVSEPTSAAESFLAYRYNYAYRFPFAAVKPLMESHMQRCMSAGPARCQVLNSSSQSYSEDRMNAQLYFRADPEFLKEFSAEITESVSAANGELSSSSVGVEDLTRQILDTDARLNAQTALRDRLQQLLETRDAELGDLLSVERELARVQGEIESATSILKALRQRISMSVVNISYETKQSAVSSSAFSPIANALQDFFRTLSHGLASVIGFFAVALPWLILVILPGLWLARRFWRKRKTG